MIVMWESYISFKQYRVELYFVGVMVEVYSVTLYLFSSVVKTEDFVKR